MAKTIVVNETISRFMLHVVKSSPVQVMGYHTIDDGGGGLFRWEKDDMAQPDGGMVFGSQVKRFNGKSKLTQGCWRRVTNAGYVPVKWFGAHGSGNHDDTLTLGDDIREPHFQNNR